MEIAISLLGSLLVFALGLHFYRRTLEVRAQEMTDNEYNTAVTLWNYGRVVRGQFEEAVRNGRPVLDFYKIAVPHGSGYTVSLELSGHSFRVYAVPNRHNRTGRLSFYLDSSLTVRASDRRGARALEQDPEYTGTSQL